MTKDSTPSNTPGAAATDSDAAEDLPVLTERAVEQASRESFPASDPPSFTPSRSGKPSRAPDDVPLHDVDESREDARTWAETLCDALDAANVDAIADMLTEDCAVRIGGADLLVGRTKAREWLASYLPTLGETDHHLTDVRVDGDAVFVEAEVNVRGNDGQKMMRPEAISARLRQGKASRLIMYGAPPLAG